VTTLTVSTVTGWCPGELAAAADRLADAAGSVADQAGAVRRHLGDAVDDAGGAWATTAADRADQEARRGEALADALSAAAAALRAGGATVAQAREALLAAVGRARAGGFAVDDGGEVVAQPAPLPPADVPPAERLGWALAPEQVAEARRTEVQRAVHEAEVAAALAAVAAADEGLADLVRRLDLPETLPSLVAGHRARTHLLDGDPVSALGTAGGAVVTGKTVADGVSLLNGGRRLHHHADLVRRGAPGPQIEEARRAFAHGTARNPVLKVAGRASMPLTVASGLEDVVSGGGYNGARGWATRGFGAAGAAGAVMVMTAAPALVVVGGTAVIAYGAWTAGNYVVDHWDQVSDAGAAAGDWVVDEATDEASAASDAISWAGERLTALGGRGVLGELF
jgi:hypothetical protein